MPSGATTNVQLNEFARCMRVPYFRGVFMHNTLPTSGAHRNESMNLACDEAWYSLDSVRYPETIASCTLTVSVIFYPPRNWCDILEMVL